MPKLPDELNSRVSLQCEAGDDLTDQGKFAEALDAYRAAWELLPEPRAKWAAAGLILTAMADAHFLQGDFAAARRDLMAAATGRPANPLVRMRLGQCMFEMGDHAEAANWFAGAFLEGGVKLFEDEDAKYLAYIKEKLDPPEGGWPEGW